MEERNGAVDKYHYVRSTRVACMSSFKKRAWISRTFGIGLFWERYWKASVCVENRQKNQNLQLGTSRSKLPHVAFLLHTASSAG